MSGQWIFTGYYRCALGTVTADVVQAFKYEYMMTRLRLPSQESINRTFKKIYKYQFHENN